MQDTLRLSAPPVWMWTRMQRAQENYLPTGNAIAIIRSGEPLPPMPLVDVWFFAMAVWMLPLSLMRHISQFRRRIVLRLICEIRRCIHSRDNTIVAEYGCASAAILFSLGIIPTDIPRFIPLLGLTVGVFQFWKVSSDGYYARAEAAIYNLIYWGLHILGWIINFGSVQPVHWLLIPFAMMMATSFFSLVYRGGGRPHGGSADHAS